MTQCYVVCDVHASIIG